MIKGNDNIYIYIYRTIKVITRYKFTSYYRFYYFFETGHRHKMHASLKLFCKCNSTLTFFDLNLYLIDNKDSYQKWDPKFKWYKAEVRVCTTNRKQRHGECLSYSSIYIYIYIYIIFEG